MKQSRFWIAVGILALVSAGCAAELLFGEDDGVGAFGGGSYLCTITAGEARASTSVVTLHNDRTLSAIDSGQGGPDNYFSSQLGSWKPVGNRRIAGKAISFRFLPSTPAIARTDFDMVLAHGHRVAGTVTLRIFSFEDPDPLNGEGTLIGTFEFTGELIKPR